MSANTKKVCVRSVVAIAATMGVFFAAFSAGGGGVVSHAQAGGLPYSVYGGGVANHVLASGMGYNAYGAGNLSHVLESGMPYG